MYLFTNIIALSILEMIKSKTITESTLDNNDEGKEHHGSDTLKSFSLSWVILSLTSELPLWLSLLGKPHQDCYLAG